MTLSSIVDPTKPYLEYAWICAPNTAGQALPVNTITTCTINTELVDTGNFGSIAANQITLAAGTYYFMGYVPVRIPAGAYGAGGSAGLYNATLSSWVTNAVGPVVYISSMIDFEGQITISSQSVFEIRCVLGDSQAGTCYIDNGTGSYVFSTLSTAGADQRTTLKLWKLS